jgi:hypothetical protein
MKPDSYRRQFIGEHPCLICGRRPADAHHLRFAQGRALGRKISDEFTVPLCRGHHREVHRCRDEARWWRNTGVDPSVSARSLWLENHPLGRGLENPSSQIARQSADCRRRQITRVGPASRVGDGKFLPAARGLIAPNELCPQRVGSPVARRHINRVPGALGDPVDQKLGACRRAGASHNRS